MSGERGEAVGEPRHHWSRRVDVLVGFTGGLAVWLVVLAVYVISAGGEDTVAPGGDEVAAAAAFDTSAGSPEATIEPAADPLDPRVSGYSPGHFRLGMDMAEVTRTTLDHPYVENKVWPQKLQAMIDAGQQEGSVNFFGAHDDGVASYVLEFCSGIVSRITERRTYSDATGLTLQQEGDGQGSFGDLQLFIEGQAPDVVLTRQYQHVYDSGRTARINIRYEHGQKPQRVLAISDTERCRRQMVSR